MTYEGLNRAQLSYDYLHTNSTTHEFLFGALAELIDNARDASATKIDIYTVANKELRGGFLLSFLDDGDGMDPSEATDIITFGKSTKRGTDLQQIGMYGNGLKSGSMRIGNDLILFTKKGPKMTCMLLSRTFHEIEDLKEVIVPIPSFDSTTKKPLAKTPQEKERHDTEMKLILKYSPYKTEAQLMKQFDCIDSKSGSLVSIYNLKLLDTGESELDVKSDPEDIILSNPDNGDFDTDEGLMPERKSFRAYTSILYVDPRMKIYIQSRKVRTKRLASCLYKPRLYKYSSNRFKARTEAEAKKAQDQARSADNKAREAESKARNLENKYSSSTNKDHRAELRKAESHAVDLRREAQYHKQISERKTRSLREPKTLSFIFGMNIEDRARDGMFVYNCSRLIKMYQKVGAQSDGGVFCSGVVGIVDVPYMVLEPTHNKQDFADSKEYRHLQKAMGEHMVQYWKDMQIAQQGVTKFWENFGYLSSNWKDSPSVDTKFVRKRAMQLQVSLQCDLCLKWRQLPFSSSNIGKVYPDDWICSNNSDPAQNRCSTVEQKLNIPEGQFKKETKSKDQKEKDLAEDIRKKQEVLEKLQKTKNVMSLKHARELENQDLDSRSSIRNSTSAKVRSALNKMDEGESDSESMPSADEEDDDRPPIKKSLSVSKRTREHKIGLSYPKSAPTHRRKTARIIETEEESEEDIPVSPKLAKYKIPKSEVVDSPGFLSESEHAAETVIKVEAKVQSTWYSGRIVQKNRKLNKWKVKFDKYPKDKYDKWFECDSKDLKIIKPLSATQSPTSAANGANASPFSPTSSSQPDTCVSQETPSSSTASGLPGSQQTTPFLDDISNGYRTCLRYFLPPQWTMDKDTVSTLSVQELSHFPLDDFFDHYEEGLRKLFQQEAATKQQEADEIKSKLSHVRKLIAKLLKFTNEDIDIDPDADTDRVDELLEACVKQTLDHQDSS